MILKLKFLYGFIVNFLRQLRIRPLGNNLRLLINSIGMVFSREITNEQYAEKHRLNTAILKHDLVYRKPDMAAERANRQRIWTFWWQGEETMPEIIRATIDSIRRSAGGKETILITKDNYADYVKIPVFILSKVNGGGVGLPHLSDYIRVSLLDEYGGLWIDSTIFCSRPLPKEIFEKNFYTVRDERESMKYQSCGLWNMQVLGSNQKHYSLFRSIRLMIEDYWQHYPFATDYLFFDSLMSWILEEDTQARADLMALPRTNTHMHELLHRMNEPYDATLLDSWAADGTYMYKLTYKWKYDVATVDSKETFYGYITKLNHHE